MIALGYSADAQNLPNQFTRVPLASMTVVAVARDLARSAEARFRLQCACYRLCKGLLPFAARQSISVEQAVSIGVDRSAEIHTLLQGLTGRSQISAVFRDVYQSRHSEENWLRRRARHLRECRSRSAALCRQLDAVSIENALDGPRLSEVAGGIRMDVLIDSLEAEQSLAHLAQAVTDIRPTGWQIHLSGPWPPHSFAKLEIGP